LPLVNDLQTLPDGSRARCRARRRNRWSGTARDNARVRFEWVRFIYRVAERHCMCSPVQL